MRMFKTAIGVSVCAVLLAACASIDKSSLRAHGGVPESTEVELAEIPYDPSYPRFVVAVEPFIVTPRQIPGQSLTTIQFRQTGERLASQLVTALTRSGNISVLDSLALQRTTKGTYRADLNHGEQGPYVVRATVTELVEEAESESDRGFYIFVDTKAEKRKGMVALDVQLLDGRTGRIVRSFRSTGTFSSASARNGYGLLFIGHREKEFARSALGQAMRVALNDAVSKVTNQLKSGVH